VSESVLLVDDDPTILDSLSRFLERRGCEVFTEASGAAALSTCQARRPDVVILDLRLPDADGLSVLRALRELEASVVLLTGHGDIETAVEAIQLGADEFLMKPVSLEHLSAVVSRIGDRSRIRRENVRLRDHWFHDGGPELLGVSKAMTELRHRIEVLATSDRLVLLVGESGTGKGWIARMMHTLSPRARGPFVEASAAGLSAEVLGSELFGHERGARADAPERRDGLVRHADRGTLLIDEITHVPAELQPRVVHFLEEGSFRRMGGDREVGVDLRLLAASQEPVEAAFLAGELRGDLFYLLNAFPIHLPPLRERQEEDRRFVLEHLLDRASRDLPGAPVRFSDQAMDILLGYGWPGNLREMRNVLELALLFGRGSDEVLPTHLPWELQSPTPTAVLSPPRFRPEALEAVERRHIEHTLRHHEGNRTLAARALGIARSTLIRKIQGYGIEG